jgi:hypothetical protein
VQRVCLPRFRSSWLYAGSAAVACFLSAGCGSDKPAENELKTFPVTGQIHYGSEPIPDATLAFHPVEPLPSDKLEAIPRAKVDKDGNFTVTTYRAGDGAPPGEYLVTVSWQGPLDGVDDEGGRDNKLPELLPQKYQDPEKSGLRVQITEGDNELPPFEIPAPVNR